MSCAGSDGPIQGYGNDKSLCKAGSRQFYVYTVYVGGNSNASGIANVHVVVVLWYEIHYDINRGG